MGEVVRVEGGIVGGLGLFRERYSRGVGPCGVIVVVVGQVIAGWVGETGVLGGDGEHAVGEGDGGEHGAPVVIEGVHWRVLI